jgi:hypothetical protein
VIRPGPNFDWLMGNLAANKSAPPARGFEICIDSLSFWVMRIVREIGRGTSVQAVRERRAR